MNIVLLGTEVNGLENGNGHKLLNGIEYNSNLGISRLLPGLIDGDLFIVDIGMFRSPSICQKLYEFSGHLKERINAGAVLICFSGQDVTGWGSYNWLTNIFAYNLGPINLNAKEIIFDVDAFPFCEDIAKEKNHFHHEVIFNNAPVVITIATNKSDKSVALYESLGAGHIFILPQSDDVSRIINLFIEKIFPKLILNFNISDSEPESIPEVLNEVSVDGQQKISEQILKQIEKIESENDVLSRLETERRRLEQWKALLWQTGTPLEKVVKRFFKEFGGIDLVKKEVDLVGKYKGKDLLIEVKGNTGCIDHKKDFRQIEERKNYETDNPENTIALLVGNPFRLLPLDQRPPSSESLFAKTSIPIAEDLGIGLVWTKHLFDLVNLFLGKPELDRVPYFDELFGTSGVYNPKIAT